MYVQVRQGQIGRNRRAAQALGVPVLIRPTIGEWSLAARTLQPGGDLQSGAREPAGAAAETCRAFREAGCDPRLPEGGSDPGGRDRYTVAGF
jgi:hypothetical protein